MAKSAVPPGYCLYKGPSLLDGKPIVIIATLESRNIKTGNMVQIWILREDISPCEAVKTGQDVSICWDCPHRGDGTGKGRTCYIEVQNGPTSVWHAYKRGSYPLRSPHHPEFRAMVKGRKVRIGAYGDPSVISSKFWWLLLEGSDGHTGYTHQWRSRPDLKSLVMASCDTETDKLEAAAQGWRSFRTKYPDEELFKDEVYCPSERVQCIDCMLCGGQSKSAKSIAINLHGGRAVMSNLSKKRLLPVLA